MASGIAVGSDRTLCAAAGRSQMVAMRADGFPKWDLKTNPNSMELNRSTPVISGDGTIYFGSADGSLYGLDSFGTTKWSLALQPPIFATPVLADDGTIFVMNGRYLSVVSPEGKLLSQAVIGSGAESSPSLAPDGTIYVATYDAKVIAYKGGHGGLMNSPWPKYQGDLANTGVAHSF